MSLLRTFFLGSSLLFVMPSVSVLQSAPQQEVAMSFCPECWRFLRPGDALDNQGTCPACGKIAVAVDAVMLTWMWCPDHKTWHSRRCSFGIYDGKPQPIHSALAMILSASDERAHADTYCPACRLFPDPMSPGSVVCTTCGGSLVVVSTASPTWFWCEGELHWKSEPCPVNTACHRCLARTGPSLLAKLRSAEPRTAP